MQKVRQKAIGNDPVTIEERLMRRAPEDVIYIGQIVEEAISGELGAVIKAMTDGRIATEAELVEQHITSDMRLGRIQAFKKVWDDLLQCIQDKNKTVETLIEEESHQNDQDTDDPED